MKHLCIVIILLTFLLNTNTAAAWSYWYYTPIPYGQIQTWNINSPAPLSGIYVEQMQLPAVYRFRFYPGNQRLQNIRISIKRGALVVRSEGRSFYRPRGGGSYFMPQYGGFIQWVLLPADANMAMMNWSVNNGVLEIIIPRLR